MTKHLIVGCGYLGKRVADQWLQKRQQVLSVTRFASRAREWSSWGVEPIVADVTIPKSLEALPPTDTVLFAVGFDRRSGSTLESVFVDGLANVLSRLSATTGRIIYISSTGVYGQNSGEWVDEGAVCRPTRAGGRACLAAETLLLEHSLADRAIVLRMAGIYGPGRIPRRNDIENQRPLAVPAEGYLNLIHVDDAARVVVAASDQGVPPGIYNVSDGSPVIRADYFQEVARLIGAPPPKFSVPEASTPAVDRARADKRIDSRKMWEQFGVAPQFPNYRLGLAKILENGPQEGV